MLMRIIIVLTVSPVKPKTLSVPPQPRRLRSEELLGGAGHVVIVHNGREYRLRVTQNGKLILTA